MKIPSKLLHILFIGIAILSILSCFPKLFPFQDDAGEINKNWIATYIFINSIATLKIELDLFLNFFGWASNFKQNFLTIVTCTLFLIAAFLYYGNKSKHIIRVLKFGILLIGFNAFFNGLFTGLTQLSDKFDYMYDMSSSLQRTGYILVAVLGNFGIAFASVVYFKFLNKEKFERASQQTNLNLEDSIFAGIASKSAVYNEAKPGQRFLNYCIDYVVMIPAIFKIAVYIIIFFRLQENNPHPVTKTLLYGSGLLAFLCYYFFMEKFYGVTVGKIITNTRVVQDDGSYITWKQAISRTLSRLVPFEWISGFSGYPWHDKWSNTYVVKEDIEFEAGNGNAGSEHEEEKSINVTDENISTN